MMQNAPNIALGHELIKKSHPERRALPDWNMTQNPPTFAWGAKVQNSSFPTQQAHRAIWCVLTLAGAPWRIFFFVMDLVAVKRRAEGLGMWNIEATIDTQVCQNEITWRVSKVVSGMTEAEVSLELCTQATVVYGDERMKGA